MRSPEELTEIFRSTGRKMTPQRQSIFRVLHGSGTHPTAEAVYEQVKADMPTVSLRTVYQTLNDLVAMGEIDATHLGTRSVRFDPNTAPHHHLVCDVCGWVQDVVAELPPVQVPDGVEGFEVAATEIVFRGRCHRCATLRNGEAGVDAPVEH